MSEHYVYIHKRKDNGVVFYIGIGTKDRAFRKNKERSQRWHTIVNESGGFDVEFLTTGLTKVEATALESTYLQFAPDSWCLVNIKPSVQVKNLKLDCDNIRKYVQYCPTSVRGLRYKRTPKGSKKKVGDVAGYLNKAYGYYEVSVCGRRYYSHRLVYFLVHGELNSTLVIDHVDGNRANNKIDNLRAVSQMKNCNNRITKPNKATGVVGVQLTMNQAGNEYFQASWVENGERKIKRFSVLKLGRAVALESAIKYRQSRIADRSA